MRAMFRAFLGSIILAGMWANNDPRAEKEDGWWDDRHEQAMYEADRMIELGKEPRSNG